MRHYFGTTLYQAVSNSDDLDVYASTDPNGKQCLLFINKSPKDAYQTTVNLGADRTIASNVDFYQLSSKEYQWSETLYKPVIDSGPSHFAGSQPIKNGFQYTFPPYSITCVDLTAQN
jgi:hypothetical protein